MGRGAFSLLTVAILTLTSCGGGGGGGDNGGLTSPAVVFVTSTEGTGNLGSWAGAGGKTGLAAADAICQSRAAAAGLKGTFVAWLSDSDDDAWCRVQGLSGKKDDNCGGDSLPVAAGPWVRTDGFPFSEAIDQLALGVIYTPARYDEFGSVTPEGTLYWTATSYSGELDHNYTTCSGWAGSDAAYVRVGAADATVGGWTELDVSTCEQTRSLLCMQVGDAPPLADFAVSGKKVFITAAGDYDGDFGGLAGGDAICRYHASQAGLANTTSYVAWLSDSSTDAKDRLDSDGPWVRIDGVPVAESKADLIDGSLFTAITVDELGRYWWTTFAWTGTLPTGSKSGYTMSDWTGAGQATYGYTPSAIGYWTNDVFSPDFPPFGAGLYCFED